MAAHHFCCCFPLRLGAFLISLFQFLIAGLAAAALWYGLGHWPTASDVGSKLKGATIGAGVYYTIFALAAFIGFIGTIRRSAKMLSTYSYWLGWALGIQIGLDAFLLYAYFSTPKDELIKDCINNSTDQNIINSCNRTFNAGKGAIIAGVALGLLVQIWVVYIVSSYGKKLENEHAWTATVPLDTGYKYAAAGRSSTEALTAPNYQYPYADGSHSFGNNSSAPYDPPAPHARYTSNV
ncbi:hypothetical protein EW146_g4363 [Bondarzewia mesenterica]|uniref:MARVEL domain-containing protein n=1 Tax=Bondarzewia mesenterica TaxID=1095465 RepID=A0A4S4LUY4_9AGAM|nr:hypothetical protein EW146_g4363 [Bondarzewia mesenterica]